MLHHPEVLLATCRARPDGDGDARLLAGRLEEVGVRTRVAVWDDPTVAWDRAGLTLIRSTWDYHLRRDEYLAWARSVPRLQNPPPLVTWNTDKRYLLDLARRVPVIPTRALDEPTPASVQAALREAGWSRGVLKPAVGLDGHGVERVEEARVAPGDRPGTWLLQPFLEGVVERGETSVIVIDGEPTHAVLRRPGAGEFRTQERLGGRVEPVEAPAEWVERARRVVAGLPHTPLYARVDLVPDRGEPLLMELELVEPSLYLDRSGEGLEALVTGVLERLGGG